MSYLRAGLKPTPSRCSTRRPICLNIRSWYQKMDKDNAQPRGIPTSLWDDGGWFKVWDIGSKSWNNNLADCIAGACDWNGTERFNAGCK